MKVDSAANFDWAASYGDTSAYYGYSYGLELTSDSGYLLIGQSFFAAFSVGFIDCVKTDEYGNTGCSTNYLSFIDSAISLSVSSPAFSIASGGAIIVSSANVGCGCFSDTTFCSAYLNLTEPTLNGAISVYPNPFSDRATIELVGKCEKGTIIITDLVGRAIEMVPFVGNKLEFDRGELKAGIYFIQIISNNSILACEKIIIQ